MSPLAIAAVADSATVSAIAIATVADAPIVSTLVNAAVADAASGIVLALAALAAVAAIVSSLLPCHNCLSPDFYEGHRFSCFLLSEKSCTGAK